MDKYKKLFSNTIVFAMGTFGSKLLMFLLLFLYTHVLTEAQYGSIDIIIQAANLLIPIAGLSIYEGTVRFALDRENNRSEVFSASLQVALIGLSAIVLLFPLLYFVKGIGSYFVLLYFYVFFATIKMIAQQFIRGIGLVKLYAINGIMTTVLTIGFNVLFLVAFNWGITGYILSIVMADFISVVFLFSVARLRRYMDFKNMNRTLRSAMLRYALPLLPTTIMWWITSFSDRYMVMYLMSEEHNGIYSAANKIPMIITMISSVFSQAWQISAVTEHHNDKHVSHFYTNVFKTYQSIVYVVAAGIFVFIKPVTQLMGGSFNITYKFTPFLILSVVLSCFVTFLGSVYVVTKRTPRGLVTTAIPSVINISANIFLIPRFGINGAAMATCISYCVAVVLRLIDAKTIIGLKYSWLRIGANISLLYFMGYMIFLEPTRMYVYLVVLLAAVVLLNFKAVLRAFHVLILQYLSRPKREGVAPQEPV